jgi:hypothetical protein
MHLVRLVTRTLVLATAILVAAAPARAMGHRGDSNQISALRDSGLSAPPNGPAAAPEIDAGVLAGAIALVTGGMLLIRRRR